MRASQHFRKVPKTGVIYVMMRAREKGFSMDSPEWANLGEQAGSRDSHGNGEEEDLPR